MENEIKNSAIRLVGLALIGSAIAAFMTTRNREPEVRQFYTAACWEVAAPHFDELDRVCGRFVSEGNMAVEAVDKRSYQIIIENRDRALVSASCNPDYEIWSCISGYQRHYARREPNR